MSSDRLKWQGHQSVDVVDGWRRLRPRNIHMLYDGSVTWRVWATTTNKLTARAHEQPQLQTVVNSTQSQKNRHPATQPPLQLVINTQSQKNRHPASLPTLQSVISTQSQRNQHPASQPPLQSVSNTQS